LVQQTSNVGHTTKWKQGRKVLGSPNEITIPLRLPITPGTIISLFDKTGKYPKVRPMHAAVYVSHNSNGIVVYDQWNSQGMAKKRTIRFKNLSTRNQNDAKWYFVVE